MVSVHPDMTKSNFYRNANFREDDSDSDFYMDSEVVADAVKSILMQDSHIAVTDITIRPQKHRIKRK